MPPKRDKMNESLTESLNESLTENNYENLNSIKTEKRCNYNLCIFSGICIVFISLGIYSGYLYYNKLNNEDDGSMVDMDIN